MREKDTLKTKLMPKSKSALIVAKVIAVAVVCMGLLLLASEVLAVCMYAIPLMVVQIAKVQGVAVGADWVIGGTLWFFPSLFLVLVLGLAQWAFVKWSVTKMFHWVKHVLRQSM